jgi:hypothetical protein
MHLKNLHGGRIKIYDRWLELFHNITFCANNFQGGLIAPVTTI